MSTDEADLGITEDDLDRLRAFGGDGRESDLHNETVYTAAESDLGDATEHLVDYLRERLTIGEEIATEAHAISMRIGRSPSSICGSLRTLADGDPVGLEVERAGERRRRRQWRIERHDGRSEWR